MREGSNRHPVDELADVRAEIKALQTREEELRKLVLSGEVGLVGDQNEAAVVSSAQSRLDRKALEKELGEARVAQFCKPVAVTTIRIAAREVMEDVG